MVKKNSIQIINNKVVFNDYCHGVRKVLFNHEEVAAIKMIIQECNNPKEVLKWLK
ncbi:hypothetical protein [Limosilactobacillus coleohominis]|uniref:hypothetical protein n=1 Tax=Limosilactobacillus coleohominis TaxID=181675 RepID=UPI0026EEAAA6|nr:hypothetical protein [Limosilactobacillus coleohominis]